MKFKDLDLNKAYTYADYLNWQFQETVELIKGKIFRMSPAPSSTHQKISSRLLTTIGYFLGNGPCEVFHAPFDVRLPLPPEKIRPDQIHTVVQPDICVICDPEKIDTRGCMGAPDWIIEILSPSTARKDTSNKFEVYQFAGVPEYWLIYPLEQQVLVYTLDENGKYIGDRPYNKTDRISPRLFPKLIIDLEAVFPSVNMAEEEWHSYVRL